MKRIKTNHGDRQLKKRRKNKLSSILLLLVGLTSSQSFAQFELKKHTINSGGATMNSGNGNYQMTSSIGQVDASNTLTSGNGNYSITGGFWSKATVTNTAELIFENSFESI